jgi:hypothetical protein
MRNLHLFLLPSLDLFGFFLLPSPGGLYLGGLFSRARRPLREITEGLGMTESLKKS